MSIDKQLVRYFDEWEQSLSPDARAALKPLFDQARIDSVTVTEKSAAPEYTCIGKGGRYELLGVAYGAGTSRGTIINLYRDVDTGVMYFRTPVDFDERMQKIDVAHGGPV